MCPRRTAVCSIATVMTVLGVSGCSPDTPAPDQAASPPSITSQSAAVPQPAELPAPEVLTDVLYRLADPEVPGADKLNLLEGATDADAATLDKFADALRDNGYIPLNLEAADIAWSDSDPGDVNATITVDKPDSDAGFSVPMEFRPYRDGWQLSRETFDMLLNFGKASTSPAPPG